MRMTAWAGLVWLVAATAAPAQRMSPPFGSQVQVRFAGQPARSGELLAIDQDSIWLLQPHGLASGPLSEVAQVRVDRGGMGASGALLWSLIAGVVSGAVLSRACSSVEGADCGGIFVLSVGLWSLVGLVSAPSLQNARYQTLTSPQPDELRARARFPQGLPAGMARDSLGTPRGSQP
jgi:hypothetical protein